MTLTDANGELDLSRMHDLRHFAAFNSEAPCPGLLESTSDQLGRIWFGAQDRRDEWGHGLKNRSLKRRPSH